jgi:PAS domain S-box-containing protein
MVARERHRTSRAVVAGAWLCAVGATLGGLGLIGWATGRESLYTLVSGQPPMMPNSAVALLSTGVVGVLLRHGRPRWRGRTVSLLLALLVLVIGVGTLLEYTVGADLHLDQLLFHSRLGPHPGRPGPLTAMALTLLGFAILSLDWHPDARQRPCEWLLIAAALTALVGLTGQVLGAGEVYRLPRTPVIGMAVPSAVGVLAVSLGLLLTRPFGGLMAVATSEGPGGVLLRRIAVPYAVTSMLLGFGITRLFDILDVDELPLAVASIAVAVTVMGLAILVITARLLERTHQALKASRARTEEVVAMASDGIFVTDTNGRFTEVNPAGLQLLGVTREEIVGQTVRDFLMPEEIPRLETLRATLADGGADIGEWHLRHKSGEYVPVEVSSRVLPKGRWQGFVRDIRERKAAEEEAKRSRQRIEGIISIAADAIISVDESQRITMFNHGAEAIFGWTASEVIGRPVEILMPKRFREAYRGHVEAFAREPESSRRTGAANQPLYGRRKDGSEFVAEAAVSKLRIGEELTFTAVLRDVTTERRRAEQDRLLSAVGLLLTSSLDRMQLGRDAGKLLVGEFADICAIDIIDDPRATPAATRSVVAHRDPTKMELARAFEGLQLERRTPRVEAAVLGAGRTTLVSEVTPGYLDAIAHTAEHRRMLEELAPTSLLSVPLQARGLLLGVLTFALSDPQRRYHEDDVAFVEEISRRLALSFDNARLFETTVSAVATRDEVLRVVAHDLRNPLSTILMLASSLQSEEDGKADKPRQSARSIEVAARRMNRLIRDLLEVTRSEAGALSLETGSIPVNALLQDVVSAHERLAIDSSVGLHAETGDDAEVRGDRDRLLQIFENLVGNAMRFTPAGGSIAIGGAKRDREVLFWVKDSGEGISAEELPHVFERFWKGRKEKRGGGAGLGLLIVRSLVEAHGGRVWVESTLGRGSSFFFTIPTVQQPAGSQRPPARRRTIPGSMLRGRG